MSTRSTTHFRHTLDGPSTAIVYRHHDGYPTGAGSDLLDFIKQGKEQNRKDLSAIMVAHNIPYMAQTTPFHWQDLSNKVRKALAVDGPTFLNILMPCPVGWHFEGNLGMDMARIAVECNYWPLYEVENGVYKLNREPKTRLPLNDWLKAQGRFKHLFKAGNEELLVRLQDWVDQEYNKLRAKCGLEPVAV